MRQALDGPGADASRLHEGDHLVGDRVGAERGHIIDRPRGRQSEPRIVSGVERVAGIALPQKIGPLPVSSTMHSPTETKRCTCLSIPLLPELLMRQFKADPG